LLEICKKSKSTAPTNIFVVETTIEKVPIKRPTAFAPNRYPHQAKGRFQFQQQPFRGKQNNSFH
jgi:hypothetical protein